MRTKASKHLESLPFGVMEKQPMELKVDDMTVMVNRHVMTEMVRSNGGEQTVIDETSIFIGNVSSQTDILALEQLFSVFGGIQRISMPTERYSQHPKGYAFLEFESKPSVGLALLLNGFLLHGNVLRVLPKRVNKPGMRKHRQEYRGRPFYGRGNRGGDGSDFVDGNGNGNGGGGGGGGMWSYSNSFESGGPFLARHRRPYRGFEPY